MKNGGEIFLTSGEMAKRGYPTWDVGVVMNEFAAKHPDQVVADVKAECEGIDYWLKHPKETVDIIAKELSLPAEDAERMMKGTTIVPCPEQLTKDYLGMPGQIGQFAATVLATATVLKDQGRLPSVMERAGYAAFIDPSYLVKALGKYPRVLLMDEPFGALDAQIRADLAIKRACFSHIRSETLKAFAQQQGATVPRS
ncbi:hypothetical protein [Xanthobacter autotrophicus]|uniref:hypothetical protein n=1 Tax=Xanthobacter autotrophicus TaxID=280 RepID=UPI00372B7139